VTEYSIKDLGHIYNLHQNPFTKVKVKTSAPLTYKSPFEDPQLLRDGDHLVQFYEDEEYLVNLITDYAVPALNSGEGVVLIGTAAHNQAFLESFHCFCDNVEDALIEGQLVLVDAEEMLGNLLRRPRSLEENFHKHINHLLLKMKSKFTSIKAFGEMVDILWKKGDRITTLELEQHWNMTCSRLKITLLCAYHLSSFQEESLTQGYKDICQCHSHVIPFQPVDLSSI
jgi:hypothetical protein